MNLYVTRHGQTEYNILDQVCGKTDIELTDLGRKQASDVAKKLSKESIDIIICSPLIRAQETASIINQVINREIIIDSRIKEIDFGQYEGVKRNHRGFKKSKKNHGYKYPGGESYFRVVQRVYNFLDELKEKYPNKNVLLVCHGGIVRTINTYFYEMTNRDIYKYSPKNCCIKKYEL